MAGRINKRYLMSNAGELYEWLPAPNEEWCSADLDKDVRGGTLSMLKSHGVIREVVDPEDPQRYAVYRTVSEAWEYVIEVLREYY